MTTVARDDLTIYQGMPFARPYACEDPYGAREPFTGWSAVFAIYGAPATLDSLHDLPAKYRFTSADGTIELGLFDGGAFGDYQVSLYLPHDVTSGLEPWGTGIYFLDIADPFGKPQLRLYGTIVLEEGEQHG